MSVTMERDGALWTLEPAGDQFEWVPLNSRSVFRSNERCDPSIDLQRRLDSLAVRLRGDDRLLVFEASSAIRQRDERLATIRQAAA